ncbi:DUF2292 domain-containing protein [Verrucomicrobia bacterium S94]|nr:DUF2292 domain-containing protein [Verrucomicrobia bacterium S94]
MKKNSTLFSMLWKTARIPVNSNSHNCHHRDESNGAYCGTQDGRWVKSVKKYVKSLDYGEVTLTVHNGQVVQVQKTEKIRF